MLGADENFWDNGNYSNPDSRYAAAVRGIQQYAELFFLGPPSASNTDGFVFAVATDTSTRDVSNKASITQGVVEALGHSAFAVIEIQSQGDIIQ